MRIDPQQHSPVMTSGYTGLDILQPGTVVPATPEEATPIRGIPPRHWINYVSYNTAGTHVAFTVRSMGEEGDPPRAPLALYLADIGTGEAREVYGHNINAVFGDYQWVDDATLLVWAIPEGARPPPRSPVPRGPNVQDNAAATKAQVRTYQDLLKTEQDAAEYEYYATTQLIMLDIHTGQRTKLGPPAMYTRVSTSPNHQRFIVEQYTHPFSFLVPSGRFPKLKQIWDRQGSVLHTVAHLPLAETIPIAMGSTRTGARALEWRTDAPAQLCWIEALDGGDGAAKVEGPRDEVYLQDWEGLQGGEVRVIGRSQLRCGGVAWGEGDLALMYESWAKSRRSKVWVIAPDAADCAEGAKLLHDLNSEDSYNDPGGPLTWRLKDGRYVLARLEGTRKLLYTGRGASPEGNRPFLDVWDVDAGTSERIWQSAPPYLESTAYLLSRPDMAAPTLDDLEVLMARESQTEPTNYVVARFSQGGAAKEERPLTAYPDPYPTIRGHSKQLVQYTRDDGLPLTATLYLPPGHDVARDGPLPTLLWAYPKDYKSKEAIGQVRRSPHEFISLGSTSARLWLAEGYAILDGPDMPILGEGEHVEANDTFTDQLQAGARAAVKYLVDSGVAIPGRIAVGGHSYGAVMTANLLALCPDLFACGIARSGAYNRTFTPFGFQFEDRTLWQIPEVYAAMSPFMHAHEIKTPLLLIHGEEDNNPGTFPIQSERMYAALKGHGAPCRLVVLPHESHSYRAQESVMHVLHEMDAWLKKYC